MVGDFSEEDTDDESESAEIVFLSLEEVEEIHADQLKRYGGREGYTNKTSIESAVQQPSVAMFGQYLHEDVAAMAAAYLYHISESQGFTDGNKRTGVVACYTFLAINGYELDCSDEELYDVAMRVAKKAMDKKGLSNWLRNHISSAA